eukprot:TRINITY_DN28877_c0_g1_i1.p1 TRINITY_DN28877_c0_g1~~TRINITY_DN28877_c0_g1_i1.p1  ORF type:complete len:166 (-),score=42.77 TRINITY_DN28877_c0_g1_i1:25-522(-)
MSNQEQYKALQSAAKYTPKKHPDRQEKEKSKLLELPKPQDLHVFHYRKIPHGMESNTVYVGRPSKFGNPFKLDDVNDDKKRAVVIEQYAEYLASRPDLVQAAISELKGKHLACWCAPKPCHADVLIRVANNTGPLQQQITQSMPAASSSASSSAASSWQDVGTKR